MDESTRLLVQGITGAEGSQHARRSVEYGTNVVAGVTPGRGGQKLDDVPVFNTVQQAVRETAANVSIIFVPAAGSRPRMQVFPWLSASLRAYPCWTWLPSSAR
jgi:succinyl-CoA synthetase alpha subunit